MGRRLYGGPSDAGRRVYDGQVIDDSLQSQLPPTKQKSKLAVNILTGVIAVALLSGGIFFGVKFLQEERRNAEVIQLWDDVRDEANEDVAPESDNGLTGESAYSTDPIDRVINWDNLFEINTDIKCWLYIPDTNMDYPVMQEQTFGEYSYLRRDIYGNDASCGSLFTPCQPEGYEDKDAHLLIFGHNMRNGSMFSPLSGYKTEEFYLEHQYIYIYYPDRTEQWQVWSAYHTNKYDMVYNIPYEMGTVEYANLLDDIESKKSYEAADVDVTTSMNILSLSTCDKTDGTNTGRFVVNAVLVDVKYLD